MNRSKRVHGYRAITPDGTERFEIGEKDRPARWISCAPGAAIEVEP